MTFISHKNRWQLYKGKGNEGPRLAERYAPFPVQEMSAAVHPWLWLCGQSPDGQHVIQRIALPGLHGETVDWPGKRLGAIASSADGERAVVLELPESSSQKPGLMLWSNHKWRPLDIDTVPDISSKIAWLDERRIVYESNERRLVVADISDGNSQSGPRGRYPASAMTREEWYACVDTSVVVFPVHEPFLSAPKDLEGFDFGTVTSLRMTHDGQVCTWTEPRFLYRSKTFIQQRDQKKMRIRQLDDGLGAVIGPYSL